MKVDLDRPRAVMAGFVVIVVIAVGVAAGTSAVAFGAYNPAWDGAWDLRPLAEETGATVDIGMNTSAYTHTPPNGTVAVVLSPQQRYTRAETRRVRAFVRRGGTLVIAGDFGVAPGNALLDSVGAAARIDGRLLRNERNHYQSPTLPVAGNVSQHDLTHGVDALTLNYGTAIHPHNATVLVRTSEFAYLDGDRDGTLDMNETMGSYAVATVESVGDGRVVVVGDPSLFINVMLDRPGNRQFVTNLLATDRVLLDYSHAGGVPPLMFVVLTLRDSTVLQLGLGFAGLGAIALWGRRSESFTQLATLGGRRPEPPRLGVDRKAMVTFITHRHPGWDEERVERVVNGFMDRRSEDQTDE